MYRNVYRDRTAVALEVPFVGAANERISEGKTGDDCGHLMSQPGVQSASQKKETDDRKRHSEADNSNGNIQDQKGFPAVMVQPDKIWRKPMIAQARWSTKGFWPIWRARHRDPVCRYVRPTRSGIAAQSTRLMAVKKSIRAIRQTDCGTVFPVPVPHGDTGSSEW